MQTNSNLIAWLMGTGLDEQRAKLYMAALTRGTASAKDLAQDLKLNRTAVYDNLRILEERGYVTTIHEGKKKWFVPLHPKELYKKFENQRQQLKDLLPDFLAMYAEEGKQPFVQMFTGTFAAREVMEDILASAKKEYVYFSPSSLALEAFGEKYIEEWVKRRVKKGVASRSLRIASQIVEDRPIFNEEAAYNRQIKYLPAYIDMKASLYIYGNNIGVISTKNESSAFIIHSPDLAYSFKQIFEFLWQIGTKS